MVMYGSHVLSLGEREWAPLNRAHFCAPHCWSRTVSIDDSRP